MLNSLWSNFQGLRQLIEIWTDCDLSTADALAKRIIYLSEGRLDIKETIQIHKEQLKRNGMAEGDCEKLVNYEWKRYIDKGGE